MICPYNDRLQTTIQQWTQEYSEENENQLPTGTTVTKVKFTPMECARENCGVFYDGRCHYNSN